MKPALHPPSGKKSAAWSARLAKREAHWRRRVHDRELMAIGREVLLRAEEEHLRSARRGRPKESAAGAASAVQNSPASTRMETSTE